MQTCEITTEYRCSLVSGCPFFAEHAHLTDLCDRLRAKYCLRDNTRCARLRLRTALGPDSVPVLMMPHQHEWADQLLLDAGKNLQDHRR